MDRQKILITDDDKALCKLLRKICQDLSFNVDVAEDGKQAVEKVIKNHYSLITMDIKMPNMNGVDAVKAISIVDPEIPIIVISGYISDSIRDQLDGHKVVEYVVKPFEVNRLKEMLLRYSA